ncbi:MAG: ABC transporter ATP-binding protein [Butyrivibrio sp.]|nr:ABC transporter ATP-binding protein [Butyrivibrio sp.]MCR4834320.1 ABC transporter ATP-binding protein [Butyrivibrio sp.]
MDAVIDRNIVDEIEVEESSSVDNSIKLAIKNVSKEFKNRSRTVKAIEDVSFNVNKGEFVSIIGPSGCGKTTLLRLITGLERDYEGSIILNGKRVEKPGLDRGVVFQDHRLLPWLTIEENLTIGIKGDKKQFASLVKNVLKKVDLEGFEKAYPSQLSGGMSQRASIARALLREPEILLLDEPLGALDALTRYSMQEELEKIWLNNKTTMIMITHDIEEAVYLSDRIVVLDTRPCSVKEIIDINLPHPRDRKSRRFEEYRSNVVSSFRSTIDSYAYSI